MFMMTINNKNESNDWGKCLGLPVTSYGPVMNISYRRSYFCVFGYHFIETIWTGSYK